MLTMDGNSSIYGSLPGDGEIQPITNAIKITLYALGTPLGVLVIVGNILLVIAIYRSAKLHSRLNLVAASLACSDIMAGVILIIHVATLYEQTGMAEEYPLMCYTWAILQLIPMFCGMLHLLLIIVDRLIAVTYPAHYEDSITPHKVRITCAILWIYTMAISAIAYAFYPSDPQYKFCDILLLPRTFLIIVLFCHIIPCVIFNGLIFGWIYHTLRVHQRKIQVTNTMTYNNLVVDIQTARMFLITFIVTIILWTPFMGSQIVWIAHVETKAIYNILRATFLVGQISHLKYVVYLIWSRDFRKGLKRTLCCYRYTSEASLGGSRKWHGSRKAMG